MCCCSLRIEDGERGFEMSLVDGGSRCQKGCMHNVYSELNKNSWILYIIVERERERERKLEKVVIFIPRNCVCGGLWENYCSRTLFFGERIKTRESLEGDLTLCAPPPTLCVKTFLYVEPGKTSL